MRLKEKRRDRGESEGESPMSIAPCMRVTAVHIIASVLLPLPQ
jgi:hypothetical protein